MVRASPYPWTYVQLRKGSLIFRVEGFPRVGRYIFAASKKHLGNLFKQKHPENRLGSLKGRFVFQPAFLGG